jgi:F0F1-type ATP synthase assembly protein I
MSREVINAISSAGESVVGIAVMVALGAWGGMWLDDRLHTTPWLAISLSLLGMVLGLTRMVVKAIQADKAEGADSSGPSAGSK